MLILVQISLFWANTVIDKKRLNGTNVTNKI